MVTYSRRVDLPNAKEAFYISSSRRPDSPSLVFKHHIPSNDANHDHAPATSPAEMRTCQGGSVAAKPTSHVGDYPAEARNRLGSSGKGGSAVPLGVPSSRGSSTGQTESVSDKASIASDTTTITTAVPIYRPTKRSDESLARMVRSVAPSPAETGPHRGGDAPEAVWGGKGDDGRDEDRRGREKVLIPEPGNDGVYFFAYGRYFDKDQMKKALPEATHVGLAKVNGYRWLLCGPRRDGIPRPRPTISSPEGRATITPAPASAGCVVYGRLYQVRDGARLEAFARARAAFEDDYELAALAPTAETTLLSPPPADDRAKDPAFAHLPTPLRAVSTLPGRRVRAFVVDPARYHMPWRGPFARPLHFRAVTVPTADVAAVADDRDNDDVGSLRDEERAAARDYVVARLEKLRRAKLDPVIAARPLPPNPFPGLEARRPGRTPLSSDAQPRAGLSEQDDDETEEDPNDEDEDGGAEADGVGNDDGWLGENETVDQTGESENYLLLLNRGVAAAVIEGLLPQWYINEVLRPWVPYPKKRLV
ncbi:hypothetical protein DL764_004447 [Monosporascus ibericus]|uniref:Uncharacterized protein n=1 Tax=Monosporascus ibericus TaxID=155417 RepID=A0A4Q4TCJ3_9PEZI|nr:hypothetical protein DL764_004447 [Monosporascus ibericus]